MPKKRNRTILIVIIILLVFLFYPWFVKIDKSGKSTCSNILGFKMNC